MRNAFKRYKYAIGAIVTMVALLVFNRELGLKALDVTAYSLKEMISVIPPIFILLGLLDIWVPKETMSRFMGEDSGLKGMLLAFFIGSAAAGPLYGAFPVAAVFMKKGVKFSNILVFIGAWSTTKIPMFLFEMTSLGAKFALTRLLINIPGIIIIASIITVVVKQKEIEKVVEAQL